MDYKFKKEDIGDTIVLTLDKDIDDIIVSAPSKSAAILTLINMFEDLEFEIIIKK